MKSDGNRITNKVVSLVFNVDIGRSEKVWRSGKDAGWMKSDESFESRVKHLLRVLLERIALVRDGDLV